MVKGMNKFKEYFKDFSQQYVFIGGAAYDLLMEDAGLDFRVTKDLDIVLIIEVLAKEFGEKFWDFIKAANYERKERSSGQLQFYRFAKPSASEYPYMIELFTRKPDAMSIPNDVRLTPIHISDECSSLSAILLNEDYYSVMLDGIITVEDLPVLRTEYIILFKAKAYLDLSGRKNRGEAVDSKNIKKHKNDVFRLISLLTGTERVQTHGQVHEDILTFIDKMQNEDVSMKSLGVTTITKEQALNMIKNICK